MGALDLEFDPNHEPAAVSRPGWVLGEVDEGVGTREVVKGTVPRQISFPVQDETVEPDPVLVTSLLEVCPNCLGTGETRLTRDWDDILWDAGDADLREMARSGHDIDGNGLPWTTSHACSCCGPSEGWGVGDPEVLAAVPAVPIDIQPAAWLAALVCEVARRYGDHTGIELWQGRTEEILALLRDLPPLPPASFWPLHVLDQARDGDPVLRPLLERMNVPEPPLALPGSLDDLEGEPF